MNIEFKLKENTTFYKENEIIKHKTYVEKEAIILNAEECRKCFCISVLNKDFINFNQR